MEGKWIPPHHCFRAPTPAFPGHEKHVAGSALSYTYTLKKHSLVSERRSWGKYRS